MSYAAFPLYSVRPSWLALGGAGRELAMRGTAELAAELAEEVRVDTFVARGLSGLTDIFLCVQSERIEGVEAYLQRLALLGAGRQLETRALWLGCAGPGAVAGALEGGSAAGQFAALYAVSGSDPAVAVATTLGTGVTLAVWRCDGLAPAEHLVLAGAADPTGLSAFHRRWLREDRALSSRPLALGRRRDFAEALAGFAPRAD